MSEHYDHIARIQDKLQHLLKQFMQLQKDKEKLQKELDLTAARERIKQQQVDELVQQVAILKATKTSLNDADKKDFDRRIGAYLKDLDKCITLLSE